MSTNNPHPSVTKNRPIGVWILTVYAAIFNGLLPLNAIIAVVVAGTAVIPPALIILLALFYAAVIIYAYKTWQGNEKARLIFIGLILSGYLFVLINNLVKVFNGQVPADDQSAVYGPIIRSVLYSAIFVWYFNRWETREFYGG